jgi:hypothetical protein
MPTKLMSRAIYRFTIRAQHERCSLTISRRVCRIGFSDCSNCELSEDLTWENCGTCFIHESDALLRTRGNGRDVLMNFRSGAWRVAFLRLVSCMRERSISMYRLFTARLLALFDIDRVQANYRLLFFLQFERLSGNNAYRACNGICRGVVWP